ncbi:hypothetical protein [Roseiflexus castenholzii]|uniref:hypothetical protein n=1 Tax=Roseiflexus castenholzii TaxID=120962 RepID=UPI003C7D738E
MGYIMLHDINEDPNENNHLKEILESISTWGWQGPPLLADGDRLLTGCHRSTACRILGVKPPVHQIAWRVAWGDDCDDLLSAYADAVEAQDAFLIYRALRALHAEGAIDDESLDIMRAEYEKEK